MPYARKYDRDKYKKDFLDQLAIDGNYEGAAQRLQIPVQTIYNWMRNDTEFSAKAAVLRVENRNLKKKPAKHAGFKNEKHKDPRFLRALEHWSNGLSDGDIKKDADAVAMSHVRSTAKGQPELMKLVVKATDKRGKKFGDISKSGEPSVHLKRMQAKVLARARQGEPLTEICKDPDMPSKTTYDGYLKKFPKLKYVHDIVMKEAQEDGLTYHVPVDELVKERVLAGVAGGQSLASVCREKGMPSSKAIGQEFHKDPEFRTKYETTLKTRALMTGEYMLALREDVHERRVDVDRARVLSEISKWSSAVENPERYGQKQQVNMNVTAQFNVHLDEMKQILARKGSDVVIDSHAEVAEIEEETDTFEQDYDAIYTKTLKQKGKSKQDE